MFSHVKSDVTKNCYLKTKGEIALYPHVVWPVFIVSTRDLKVIT